VLGLGVTDDRLDCRTAAEFEFDGRGDTASLLVQTTSTYTPPHRFTGPFPPPRPGGLLERFECRYTPKYGYWLNLAETELGVLASRCLDRRIPDKQTIADEGANLDRQSKRQSRHRRLALHCRGRSRQLKSLYPSL
jgi:hypothetical protein